MYNFSILRDLKKMLLLINCCNERGNHAISQNWHYFRSRKVFFYTLLNQCNTTDKHNHTHTHTKKKDIQQLSVIPQDSKNLTEKKQRISFKSFRELRHAMLVLALQNFARVVSLSSLNKLQFLYFHSSSRVELRLTQIFSIVPSNSR